MVDRLERLLNLVIALRETRRPMTAEEIRRRVAGYDASGGEAFRRMLERDKADLRALGVPLLTEPLDPFAEQLGYRIDPADYDLPDRQFTAGELTALALAVQLTGLADDAVSGLQKLAVDADAPELPRRVPEPRVGLPLEAPHRGPLMEALLQRRTVRFSYEPAGREAAVRTVDPHALLNYRGRWYLRGHDHDRGERRTFRLDRIRGDVRTVGGPGAFEIPDEEVNPRDVVPPAATEEVVEATVAASPDVAWLVARRARGGGTAAADGWTRYGVRVGDRQAFIAWILDFGPDVVVEGPRDLRDAVLAHLRAVLERAGA